MATRGHYRNSNLFFRDNVNSPAVGASLWETFPALAHLCDPSIAHVFFEDFHSANKSTEQWILTQATSGTGVAGVLTGGVFTLDAGATTDGQGPQVQLAGVDFTPAANKHIWYETRLKVSHISGDFYIGLAELDTTISASSDTTLANSIGLSSYTGNGILLADCEKASARSNSLAVHTLVADTYVKLGFYVNGVTSITFYVNGVANATTIATANIPIVGLTPSFSVHATGTDQAVMHVDYVKVAQLR